MDSWRVRKAVLSVVLLSICGMLLAGLVQLSLVALQEVLISNYLLLRVELVVASTSSFVARVQERARKKFLQFTYPLQSSEAYMGLSAQTT